IATFSRRRGPPRRGAQKGGRGGLAGPRAVVAAAAGTATRRERVPKGTLLLADGPLPCAAMNRIVEPFDRLPRDAQKGLFVYIGAGDPDLAAARRLALAFDEAGVDVLELGVPFSDPLADGLVNQLAAQRGLESGTTPPKVLEAVAAIRQASQVPV